MNDIPARSVVPKKPTKTTTSDKVVAEAELLERDRFTSGAFVAIAYGRADDPAGDLARLQIGIGIPALDYRFVEMNPEAARATALALLAFANGNWVDTSEQELEVRHGQLRLELERAHG